MEQETGISPWWPITSRFEGAIRQASCRMLSQHPHSQARLTTDEEDRSLAHAAAVLENNEQDRQIRG